MRYKPVELEAFCNRTLIWSGRKPPKKNDVLDADYVRKCDFPAFGKSHRINGVDFRFSRSPEGRDHIVCENQRIPCGGERVSAVHLIGFTYWGEHFCYFTAVYGDGSQTEHKVFLLDWCQTAERMPIFLDREQLESNVKALELPVTGRERFTAYLHQTAFRTDPSRRLEELLLPDDMFLHLFAVTLEIN